MLLLFFILSYQNLNTLKRIIPFLLTALLSGLFVQAQLKSPEEFLGYQMGTRFTQHHKIVDYFNHVAANSKMVSIRQYGETVEHRPLIVAFIGTEANISRLEDIRKNNLLLARQGETNAAGNKSAPAIIWMSYNVHGNEPTSSEAALLTLFDLVNPSNTKTKEWLQNIVVAIDPCENPDGRDRYVNWYNGIVGNQYDPLPISREHREPWPGGRSNHYNFDLNRDWAWQTQKESRYRIALYNQWLPQVHIDFHEQSYNVPYFFPPAAEPYHDVITPWQREFQTYMGNNHAAYFDRNNWLYFTRERFDLFYPSYGDTYPIYNGSIGFTYEQGGIGGGLGIKTAEGDTLTFVERVAHHHTTSLSTVEVGAKYSTRLVNEFDKYFSDAVAGKTGEYKTYIMKYSPADAQRINSLKELLDKIGIQYGASTGSGKGINYFSKKDESFSISPEDLVISAVQPKAAMVKALFEPETFLSDSITYDITAWAMPYCYGINAFASKQIFNVKSNPQPKVNNAVSANPYGYVFPYAGGKTSRAISAMLKQGIRLRVAPKPFSTANKQFDRGAIIVLKTGNTSFGNSLWEKVRNIANENNVYLTEVSSGMVDNGADFGSDDVRAIKKQNIVLVSGEGVNAYAMGEIWSYFDNELHYPIHLINNNDIQRMNWANIDVLIMPDGRYDFLNDKNTTDKMTAWLNAGGKIIALESAARQLAKQPWSAFKEKEPATDKTSDKNPSITSNYGSREREAISETTPGAIFKVRVDNTHPLMFGYPDFYYTLKADDYMFSPAQSGEGWNVGVMESGKAVSGFVGAKLKKTLSDGVLFAVQDIGRGNVVFLNEDVLFRLFWENGKLMFFNATFLVGE